MHVVLGWARRPQYLCVLLAVVLVLIGYLLQPAQAVIRAYEPSKVLAATVQPVDCSRHACMALTFDDGPDAAITPQILDTLKRHNVHATFFVMGRHIPGNEALLRRIHDEGHEIGNHSWNHPYFTRLPQEQILSEITSTEEAITKTGVPAPHLFRPPYGDINQAVASQIPLTVVRWNIDPEDWHPKKREHMLEHMAAYARPGGVVVLHDTEVTTAQMLDPLLTQLESQYTLVTVSNLLDITPGQRGVFFGRWP
jgi:peptidoglycan/xylan/chitin deacetylase (PgdA/CDA1 family)